MTVDIADGYCANHLTRLPVCEHRRTWPGDRRNPIPGKCDGRRIYPLVPITRPSRARPPGHARRALLRATVFETRDRELWSHRPAVAEVRGHRGDRGSAGGRHRARRPSAAPSSSPSLPAPSPGWALARRRPCCVLRDQVIIRHRSLDAATPTRRLAERIWARVGRVTGTIVAAQGREFLVAAGPADSSPQHVVVAAAAARQVQVRFPKLAPGYLLDVIGTRHGGQLLAVVPATAQPPYRAGHVPPPMVNGPLPASRSAALRSGMSPGTNRLACSGSATRPSTRRTARSLPTAAWGAFGCRTCRSAVRCASATSAPAAQSCCPSPATALWPGSSVTGALQCGTSPKGRLADLTMAAFVELGGNLEDGCFNATMTLAG